MQLLGEVQLPLLLQTKEDVDDIPKQIDILQYIPV